MFGLLLEKFTFPFAQSAARSAVYRRVAYKNQQNLIKKIMLIPPLIQSKSALDSRIPLSFDDT